MFKFIMLFVSSKNSFLVKYFMNNYYPALQRAGVFFIGSIHWKAKNEISLADKATIKAMLVKDYYIILTRRRNHLSTFFINMCDFFLTGKKGFWSHALMNMEDEVDHITDFRLVESTADGVHYSPFDKVFDVQSVALLKPKLIQLKEWTGMLDAMKEQIGKPYDTLFNVADDSELTCVELIRTVLMKRPLYSLEFASFEKLIKTNRNNLTPQMLFDCGDFEIAYRVNV